MQRSRDGWKQPRRRSAHRKKMPTALISCGRETRTIGKRKRENTSVKFTLLRADSKLCWTKLPHIRLTT
jgi:hypothetical protein